MEADIVAASVVGEVEIVGLRGEFGGEGVYLLDAGTQPFLPPALSDFRLRGRDDAGYLYVGEALALGLGEQFARQRAEAAAGFELAVGQLYAVELVEEPLVYLGELVYAIYAVALLHGRGYREDTAVGGVLQGVVEVLAVIGLVADEAVRSLAYHAQALLYGLLEVAAYGHDLSDALHAGAYLPRDTLELGEVPAGNLAHDIVESGLEERRGGLGHGVLELEEPVAEAELGCYEREGIPRGLGRERRRAAEPRVDLYDPVVLPVGAERVLDVALSDYAYMAYYVYGGLAQEVELLVGECLRRGNDYALAGMYAQRVEVLHVADRDAVVVAVAHHLGLDLRPAAQRLLDQHLGREREGLARNCVEFGLVLAEARAEASERIGCAYDDGIADRCGGGPCLLEVGGGVRAYRLDAYLVELAYEQLPVLGVDYRLYGRSEHPYAVAFEHSAAVQLDSAVEGRLSSEREQYALRLLLEYDLLDEERGHRQEIHLVRHALGSLHRRDVGVDQDGLYAFLAQGLQRLRAAVVELAGLSYLECSGTEHQYFLYAFVDHSAIVSR